MSGSDHSGEDMEAGRVNRADDRTMIWGQNNEDDEDFNGSAVLIVEVAQDPVDPDDYSQPQGWVPDRALDAIHGNGSSGRTVGSTVGGTGVVGRGGDRDGTGVLGIGGGGGARGSGGIGAHGIGGGGPQGAGVVGQGARFTLVNPEPYGAGVVGVGGGSGRPLPPSTEVAGAGVFGRGADIVAADLTILPPPIGLLSPGVGVAGRGGTFDDPAAAQSAAGVVGVAGGHANPTSLQTNSKGVYGAGPTGVAGHGDAVGVDGTADSGPGVHGFSPKAPGVAGDSEQSRGGRFSSVRQAQIQLVPYRAEEPMPGPVPASPTEIPTVEGRTTVVLPRDGAAGDLMALVDPQQDCTLWFCVRDRAGGTPARWAQVLLGKPFDGTL